MKNDPEYRKSFDEAREEAWLLEGRSGPASLQRHIARPQAIGGGKVMMVTEFSDQLLMFLLKCRNPKVFGIGGRIRCTSTVNSRLRTSCDRADRSAWHARPLRKRLQRQRQSRWIPQPLELESASE